MKVANVTPLYKLGKRNVTTNYRPILLLMTMSKVLEKLIYSQTYNFFVNTNQLYQSQYGFRKKHSCEHAIQELVGNVLKGFENKKYTCAVFLYLSKAFGTLEHHVLLQKLSRYGIRGIALKWFESYLSCRKINVKCHAGNPTALSTSDTFNVNFGVWASLILNIL